MEARDLKKLSLSNLAFIVLSPTSKPMLKKFAEIEIQYRMRNLGIEYQDFLHNEDITLSDRGYDLRNYLIGPNPTMQQLMETYFTYLYGLPMDMSHLLFSERHLCNQLDFKGGFFNKVCDMEIFNLERIEGENPDQYDELSLDIFKEALERRKANQEEAQKYVEGSEIFTFSDAAQYISDGFMLEFATNITDEQYYQIESSKLKLLKHMLLQELNDGLLDADFFQDLFALKKTLEDRSKLNSQMKMLLAAAKNGNAVNYGTPEMQATLTKVRTYLNNN